MPHAFQAREIARRAQDGGRARHAGRWFSGRTIWAAGHYRDWSWGRLALYALAALVALTVSRLEPTQALSPWLFLSAVIGGLWVLRAAALKLLDELSRPIRD